MTDVATQLVPAILGGVGGHVTAETVAPSILFAARGVLPQRAGSRRAPGRAGMRVLSLDLGDHEDAIPSTL